MIMISTAVVAVMMVMAAKGGNMLYLFGMNAGTAVAVIAYVGKVFGPLEDIGMEIQSIQSAVAGEKRIEEFLKEPERTETDLTVKAFVLQDQTAPVVEFSGVRFGYDRDIPVLENISFAVKRGEKVTFTGRTGIGKSTAFRLILGLYVPQKGTVKIFGTEASRIPDPEKRKLFGYAEQTFQAVNGTVAEQISLFDPSLDRKQIENAALLSGIHEKILTLEKGYDTAFREDLFSQGQIQLLSIARAIVADPPVLLLDEMTANLDSGTEAQVMDALLRVSGNRTVLSISHRYAEISGGRTVEFR